MWMDGAGRGFEITCALSIPHLMSSRALCANIPGTLRPLKLV